MATKATDNPNAFILPDLGEGVHEAELISWKVAVGDYVTELQVLAEMETDKALVEVPSPRAGEIAILHGAPGDIMKVGQPLVTFVDKAAVAEKTGSSEPAQIESVSESVPGEREDAGTVVGSVPGPAAGVSAAGGKALATPAVRRLARDLGVDIDTVTGTGMAGRVTERDVRAAAEQSRKTPVPAAAPPSAPAPSAPAPTIKPPAPASVQHTHIPPGDDVVRIPFRGVRRTIANRLRQSIDQAVHFTVMDDADVTALDTQRRRLSAASGEKLSYLPFIAAALGRVLTGSFGVLNSTVDDQHEEIVEHRALHLGIATDTDTGLMVPTIRDCDALGVLEIARHIKALANAARTRSIPREQLMGSTFTVSNVGSHAGRYATPVINYPEVGILGVGRAREGMVVKNGTFRVGMLLPLSLACDHRVVDGATAALALAEIIRLLQDPEQLLAPARTTG